MAEQKKPFPYGSYIVAHCAGCSERAYVVCVLCKQGWCKEHTSLMKAAKCIHGRRGHDDLRLLQSGGYVNADEVTFFS